MGGRAVRFVGALAVLGAVLAAFPVGASAGGLPPDPSGQGPMPEPTAFVPFSPNVRVNSGNSTYAYQVEPTMKVNFQGRVFVGWKEAFTHDGGGQRVSFSSSADGGATWSPNVLMDLAATTRQSDPWLSITDDDRVFFTRLEFNSAATVSGISVSNATNGAAWGTTHFYSDAPMFADKETAAHDAAGNLYWAWNTDNQVSGVQDIVVTRSDDGGQTWTPEAHVPDPGDGVLGAFVDVHPNGTVLLTWWSYFTDDVWFDRSFDGGATWGADVRVNDIPGSAGGWFGTGWVLPLPAMAVSSNGTIYASWPDYRAGNHDILFARSADGGATWSRSVRLNDDSTLAPQWMPDLALDPYGGIHVAWMDDRDGVHNVYYVNSTDGGTAWGPNVRVTDAPTPLSYTRPGDYLAIESDRLGNVYVVWTDGRGADLDIYFAKLERSFLYQIDTSPPGLTVDVDGIARTAPYDVYCLPGAVHTVSAPTPQGTSGTRHLFQAWTDGGARTHTVTCDRPGASIADFATEYAVTLDTSPAGLLLAVDGAPSAAPQTLWWAQGSLHGVDAPSPQGDATTRRLFDSWSDGAAQNHSVTATAPLYIVAFYRTQFHLTVNSARGTVACGAPDCWFDAGAQGTFSVAPSTVDGPPGTRHVFAGWSGDFTGPGTSGNVTMDWPKSVTAAWTTQHRLTVTSPYGNPTGAGWHDADLGATASIDETEVVANGSRYRFVGWIGDAAGTGPTIVVHMDGPKSLVAVWEVVPPPPAEAFPWWALLVALAAGFLLVVLFLWRRRKREPEGAPEAPAPPPNP